MRVTFIRPNIYEAHSLAAMEVLCFAILKALTPPDIETRFYDERLEPIPFDEETDLVAITVETFTARRAYQIALNYRRRGAKVVMGGFHPNFMTEEALLFADAVVQGDAEAVWPRVLRDFKAGKLRRIYDGRDFPAMSGITPDRSIFKGKRYLPAVLVQFCRGCKFNCSFCSIRAFYGRSMRQRPIQEIVGEISGIDAKHVLFVDDNLYIDTRTAKKLFTALIPLNIKWSCQISIDVARDPEVLDLMTRSGCVGALIGFESLSPATLKAMNKSWNLKWHDYDTSIKRLQDAGVMIYGSFVFGLDHDDASCFDEAVEFAIRHKFITAGFNPLMPTPGTKTYDTLKQEGRLIYDSWWVDPTYRYGRAVFHPKGMTVDEFEKGCYRARTNFSTYSSILTRLFDRRTNMGSAYRFWLYNLANITLRKEVHEKQEMPLGSVDDVDPFEIIQRSRSGASASVVQQRDARLGGGSIDRVRAVAD
jgi:radical SAM superfamily enzyme YgiQ (UPF0313 family)